MPPHNDLEPESRLVLLQEILERHRTQEYTLPRLERDAWWFEDELKSAVEWLLSYVRGKNADSRLVEAFFDNASNILALILIATILIVLFYAVRAWFRAAGASYGRIGEQDAFVVSDLGRLEKMLDAAKSSGDWARAMRLRWRMFLFIKDLPAGLTLREFYRSSSVPPFCDILDLYRAMFVKGCADAGPYQRFDLELKELETT